MALTKEDLQAISALLEPINNRLDTLEQRQADVQESLQDVQESLQHVRTSQLTVELEQYPRIAAALDGVVSGMEKNKEQDERLIVLEQQSDHYDTRIHALEASLKKAL